MKNISLHISLIHMFYYNWLYNFISLYEKYITQH